jgi:hypothetical protein
LSSFPLGAFEPVRGRLALASPHLFSKTGTTTTGAWMLRDQEGRFAMARVLVVHDDQDRILLDEHVRPIHFEDEHASLQILERLAWAIREAHESEEYALHT